MHEWYSTPTDFDIPFEDFLHKNLNKDAKVYIYERECPFISKETLNAYFGNIAFVQCVSILRNDFNIRFIANCNKDKLIDNVSKCNEYNNYMILRIGLLKYFFAERFDPFQETMNRILAMEPTKIWIKEALDKNNIRETKNLEFYFYNGQLLTIL